MIKEFKTKGILNLAKSFTTEPMKNERLKTLEQKYEELGKEIEALKKEEKNNLPMSWEEYCKMYITPQFYDAKSNFGEVGLGTVPNKYKSLRKLELLRDAWGGHRGGNGFNISIKVKSMEVLSYVFCFKTDELRDRFQSTFSDLIEEAKELL